MTVLIVGGGIGGLTAALSLHQVGIDCAVFEQARHIRPLGVGINLLPHAVRELTELGLAEDLARTAIPTEELIYHTKRGTVIWREPRGMKAGYNWPQYSIHRGHLQMILFEAARKRLGPHRLHTGAELVEFDQDEAGVTAHFRGRRTGRDLPPVRGTVLIGADGIHSTVRRKLLPDEGAPLFSGMMMWRGAVETAPFLSGRTMVMAGHWNAKIVIYPISAEAARRGRALVNWVAEVRTGEQRPARAEDWSRRGTLADFLPAFGGWHLDFLDIEALFRSTEEIFEYPMVDRDPAPRWTQGRVTLLGDAAHPMYPIGSNGGSQAILDARALAGFLAREPDMAKALGKYDDLRRPETSDVVLANRAFGPEQVMQLVEERCPDGTTDIHAYVSREEMEAIARRYKATAGFDPEALNARPSFVTPRA